MAAYPGMKPMLEFTCEPSRCENRPRRRRRAIKTPKNPRVKTVPLSQKLNSKWISPQFNECSATRTSVTTKTKKALETNMAPPIGRRRKRGVSQTRTKTVKQPIASSLPAREREPLQELDQNSSFDEFEPNFDPSSSNMSQSRGPLSSHGRIKCQKQQRAPPEIATAVHQKQDFPTISYPPLCSTQDVDSPSHNVSQTLAIPPTPKLQCPEVCPQQPSLVPRVSTFPQGKAWERGYSQPPSQVTSQSIEQLSDPHQRKVSLPQQAASQTDQQYHSSSRPTLPQQRAGQSDQLYHPSLRPQQAASQTDRQYHPSSRPSLPQPARPPRAHHHSEAIQKSSMVKQPECNEKTALHRSHSAEELHNISHMMWNMSVDKTSPNVYPRKSTTTCNQSMMFDVTTFMPFSASTPYMEGRRPSRKSQRLGIARQRDCTVPRSPMPGVELFRHPAPLLCHKREEIDNPPDSIAGADPPVKVSSVNVEFPSSGNKVPSLSRGEVEPSMVESEVSIFAVETPYHLRNLPLHQLHRYVDSSTARQSSIVSNGTRVVEDTFCGNRSDVEKTTNTTILAPETPSPISSQPPDKQTSTSVRVVNSTTILETPSPTHVSYPDNQTPRDVNSTTILETPSPTHVTYQDNQTSTDVNSTTILAPETPSPIISSQPPDNQTSTSVRVVNSTILTPETCPITSLDDQTSTSSNSTTILAPETPSPISSQPAKETSTSVSVRIVDETIL